AQRPAAFEAEAATVETPVPAAVEVSLPERVSTKETLVFQPPLPDDPGPDGAVEETQEGERKW
ncbi:MAG: hypothetical protein Q8L92_05315, partial [Rubrivivax sp.]|nr:hypothetical protein [Rubrivivax sp.]